jgi:predicted ABC-type transport system involved in lysophospholipase L1 biosynthesis ATPase subunit
VSLTKVAGALVACRSISLFHGRSDARVEALRDVDLEIKAGETIALWGRSGSGKTSLLHVIGGLVAPSVGEVRWRDATLSTLDTAARAAIRARGIAYVFQGVNLLPHFTAYENVQFALCTGRRDMSDGNDDRAAELLALVGLAAKLDALPGELSGGEAQRVAIARALAQTAELLLCDEPTGQLDSDTGGRVLDLIDALQKEFGFALVVATHDEDVAARYGRIVELSDGRMVADAPL